MLHDKSHELAGKTVRLADHAPGFGGALFHVEDYWDKLTGRPWHDSPGNMACIDYAFRLGQSNRPLPPDNEILYGKVNGYGKLFHVSDILPDTPVDA